MGDQKKLTSTSQNKADAHRNRQLLFEYPALPRWEFLFYFAVVIGSIIYAWTVIYIHSRSYKWDAFGVSEAYEDVKLPFGLGTHRKDATESEWSLWKIYFINIALWMIGHSVLFNIGERILPQNLWSIGMLVYWLTAHVAVAGQFVIMAAIIEGIVIYFLARFTRSKALTWLAGLGIIYWTSATDYFVTFDQYGYGYYVVVLIFPYKTVAYLSFVTEMLDDRKIAEEKKEGKNASKWEDSFLKSIFKMFWYAFYLPYCCHLIVIYRRFPNQLQNRSQLKRDFWAIAKFGLRILLWGMLTELVTYLFYFDAMMQNFEYLTTIRKDTLVVIGYAVGQFFHLKYVVIFGVPAFFARLDNMQPFDGPICIARVSLYSKIWRYFDKGLYDFFKEYIFLPICRPTFSIPRKIVGVFVSYGFVVVWHGTTHQYIVWIILNISELFLETTTKVIYTIPAIKHFREKYISDRNFRRILAWLQVVTFAFGLYSNFYFLGSSESGWVFVDRIFWQETVTVKWPFILLICQGYCFSHVCMEVDRWQSAKRKIQEGKKKA